SQSMLFTSNSKEKFYGVVLDGAWLFEKYMNTVIIDVFYHPNNTEGTGGNYLFSGGAGKIYPDFISKGSKNRIIADAKYKPMQIHERKSNDRHDHPCNRIHVPTLDRRKKA